ncbi:dipicolinate synthase subunit DpsA [Domibacillus mangrovi]|nr:dipicolinate synthase subunit DpsA [Domibacillus mangrovi]
MNAVLFGGDARQLEISRILVQHGYDVCMIGFEQIEIIDDNVKKIKTDDLHDLPIDLFVLPVSGVKKNGEVDASFANEPLFFTKEIADKIPESCAVMSGIKTAALKQMIQREVTFLFEREDAAIHNSIPTAEGTLMIAMQQTPFTIHQSKVVVVGFGRVGMTTARLFHQVGAIVSTAVRETGKFARASEMGLDPFYMEELHTQAGQADIVINTVPALLLTDEVIRQMKKTAIIIDLASMPGGTDFKAAEAAGIQAIHALGLPGKTAPETAGKILGQVIVNAAREWKMERGL